ncbi:MAG: BamA/TamA family outer membrane protein [Ignavibacteriaceae bacterium]|nr:BamA/TamA family outer membrane protein [Ignavibacteriaceae bacterium]
MVLIFLICSLICFNKNTFPKDDSTQVIEIIPNPEYQAGSLHKFIFGEHWRDLWISQLSVEVLDLKQFAGGLKPIERGGGMQTLSLRFQDADKNIWKFRSIDKNPEKILSPELRESIVEEILQDQISSSHPGASLIVSEILDAMNLLHSPPAIYYLPDDSLLGEFRNDFGGLLGTLEIHPDETEDNSQQFFKGAEKIMGTYKLLNRLEEKRNEQIDAKDYLKARIIDLIIGDWDRHMDQWRWAKYNLDGKEIWKPIPRDRDQAFSKFDGLLPSIAEYFVPQLNHFDYEFPDIKFLTWNGRYLDRRILPELNRSQWDSIAAFVSNKFSDELIERALKKLPPQHYEICADEIRSKLNVRRNNLSKIIYDYYNHINEIVDVFGSIKNDFFLVERLSNKETRVTFYKKDKDPFIKREFYFQKTFDNAITKEIRIHCLDGDDSVFVSGTVYSSPLIRIIGGDGADHFVDVSKVEGHLLLVLPFQDSENKTLIYDHGKKTEIVFGPGTIYNDSEIPDPEDDSQKFEPLQEDRYSRTMLLPYLDYNGSNGISIGGTIDHTHFNFRKSPYEYYLKASAYYTSISRGIFSSINYKSKALSDNVNFLLEISAANRYYANYFGFGNETGYERNLEEQDFYFIKRRFINCSALLEFYLIDNLSFKAGPLFSLSSTQINNQDIIKPFINTKYIGSGLDNYSLNGFTSLSIFSSLNYDTRNNLRFPTEGMYLNISAQLTPVVFKNKFVFSKAAIDVRKYVGFIFFTESTFALRIGAEKIWGRMPFYEFAFLGGADNLRGYSSERFAGDSKLFFQSEIRSSLTQIKFILKGEAGISIFAETGRVWVENIKSKKWHPSLGGGIWLGYLKRGLVFSVCIANSPERTIFYFQTAMMF